MRVLIVKISSMGDLIHTLPALTDACHAIPKIQFDWLCDPSFAEIPTWHTGVNKVILAPTREWKKNKWQTLSSSVILKFKKTITDTQYDFIIDAQSALKTAIISTLANGIRTGMDAHSVREYGAQWFYHKKYYVDKNQHAITRQRQLFARALQYTIPKAPPNFGIDRSRLKKPPISLPQRYIVCIHATTWTSKHWQETQWQQLINFINERGLHVLLPAGNEKEKEISEKLAKGHKYAHVLPKLSLSECATIIANAQACVCVDTGLGHIARALETPSIHLYGPTDCKKIGAYGPNQILLASNFKCAPCSRKTCSHKETKYGESICLKNMAATKISNLLQLLSLYT